MFRKFILCAFLTLTLLGACSDPGQQRELDRAVKSLGKAMDDAASALREAAPAQQDVEDAASSEWRKLSSIEYRVLEMDDDLSAAQMGAMLQQLGAERWSCFSIVPVNNKLRAFCTRRPESYLRYIERYLPIPLL